MNTHQDQQAWEVAKAAIDHIGNEMEHHLAPLSSKQVKAFWYDWNEAKDKYIAALQRSVPVSEQEKSDELKNLLAFVPFSEEGYKKFHALAMVYLNNLDERNHPQDVKDLIIQGMEEGAEEWQREAEDIAFALHDLVILKDIKDKPNKTAAEIKQYEMSKPEAWERARKVLQNTQAGQRIRNKMQPYLDFLQTKTVSDEQAEKLMNLKTESGPFSMPGKFTVTTLQGVPSQTEGMWCMGCKAVVAAKDIVVINGYVKDAAVSKRCPVCETILISVPEHLSTPPSQPTEEIVKALTGEPLVYSPSVTTGGDLPDAALEKEAEELLIEAQEYVKSTRDKVNNILPFFGETLRIADYIAGRKHSSTLCPECLLPAEAHPLKRICSKFSSTQAEQKWIPIEDGLPKVDDVVLVETNYLESGKEVVEVFTGFMDEYGDLFSFPSEENYGWQFNDVVRRWCKIPTRPALPSPPLSKDSKTEG